MALLLCVKANPKPVDESKSLNMAKAFLEVYRQKNPRDQILELDLYRDPVPFLDQDVLSGWGKLQRQEEMSPAEKEKAGKVDAYTEQFLSADKYVLVTPMWDLTLPPMMIAYIDTIVIAGKTFNYTEHGPVGMVKGKKALHIHARGGYYSQPPWSDLDFADRYLKSLFAFLGVEDFRSVICEGHEHTPQMAESIIREAVEKAKKAAEEF